jgi:hypothetical protein
LLWKNHHSQNKIQPPTPLSNQVKSLYLVFEIAPNPKIAGLVAKVHFFVKLYHTCIPKFGSDEPDKSSLRFVSLDFLLTLVAQTQQIKEIIGSDFP